MTLTMDQTISLARQSAEWLRATDMTIDKLYLINDLLRDITYISTRKQFHDGRIIGYDISVWEPKDLRVVFHEEIPMPNLSY